MEETKTLQTVPVKKVAIFASGAGSNTQNIIEYFRANPSIQIKLIVCNKASAGVNVIARENNIPVLLIEKEKFFREDAYLTELHSREIDLIVLAGFLWKIPQPLIEFYQKRIINIHPALLPAYGGKGMYGSKVHEAVINSGDLYSGITIHYADEHYDNGDVIFQAKCRIEPNDTAETLATKIHALEHEHFPMVIEKLLTEGIEKY